MNMGGTTEIKTANKFQSWSWNSKSNLSAIHCSFTWGPWSEKSRSRYMVMLEVKSQVNNWMVFSSPKEICVLQELPNFRNSTNNNIQQYIAHECKESCQEGSFFYPLKNQSLTLNRRAGWEVGIVKKAISCHLQ